MGVKLWKHQRGAIGAALEMIGSGGRRGLWVMPTGSGKTVAFSTLAARLGLRTLVVVHRVELATQAADEMKRQWPEASVGLMPGEGWESAHVVIATVQSLSRQLGEVAPDRFGLVVVDEAHHATSPMWQKVLAHFDGAFVLGCTATPDRLDGKDVEGVFGGVIYEYTLADAMDAGVIVPVRQYGITSGISLAEMSENGRDFPQRRLSQLVRSDARNRCVVEGYLLHGGQRPALVFAVDVAHAEELRAEFERRGIAAATVTGQMKDADRRGILDRFRDGKIQVLTSCEVLTEGYDERGVGCVLMARPTMSRSLYYQCVGRGMRSAEGKADCIVIDVIDKGTMRHPVVASDLFGARVPDCKGEDIRLAAEQEKERWRLHPVSPSASLEADWDSGTETRWEELPCLEGYASSGRQERGASDSQVRMLTGFYRLKVNRPLTVGEACHLIDRCRWLEEKYPTPATPAQRSALRSQGMWKEGMTKQEARRRSGVLFAKRR